MCIQDILSLLVVLFSRQCCVVVDVAMKLARGKAVTSNSVLVCLCNILLKKNVAFFKEI